jgi:Baculoviridae P74 N-terminal/Baculoviridae p74 conserved region
MAANPPSADLTQVDIMNSLYYAHYLRMLRKIPRWRSTQPHIFTDYEVRPANFDDFYVPPLLRDKAVIVKWTFSERGCTSMSCYPFHETGPIDRYTRTDNTQTSETAIMYAQPACFHLDRAAALREGAENEIQAPELRFAAGKCILVDTMSKVYMNTPYIRTDEHRIQGIDDVPAFNVAPSTNPIFPERFDGTFNSAYCRRFGRSLIAGGCSLRPFESLLGFVMGDMIYITMKLFFTNVFSELDSFDYKRPSPELPVPIIVDSDAVLERWRNVRDATADIDFEQKFVNWKTYEDLGIDNDTKLIYRAEHGYTRVPHVRRLQFRVPKPLPDDHPLRYIDTNARTTTDEQLNFIIATWLEDNALLLGLLTDMGFDKTFEAIKKMLKHINKKVIPAMKQALLYTTRRITVRILGETYKSAVTQAFSRIAIRTISTLAKAMTRIAIKAASVIGIILIIMTLTDLILSFWDPFNYNNMFPRQFPDDMSVSFLTAYFDSINNGSRDLIEFVPDFFDELLGEDFTDPNTLSDSMDYIATLDVNSNGQMLYFDDDEQVTDFDEVTLVGNALSTSALYTYLDFMQYTERHNDILLKAPRTTLVVPVLCVACAILLWLMPQESNVVALFIIFLLIALYLIVQESLFYYMGLREHTYRLQTRWYDNLYNEEW